MGVWARGACNCKNLGPLFNSATDEANNLKFGIQLGVGEWLAKKQLLRSKLAGFRARGASKKNWDPYLFLQPLKLATSNLVYNLGLPRNNFYDQNWRSSGLGEHQKKLGPLLSLGPQLQIWYTTSVWGVRYNNNFSTELGRGWLGHRSTSKIVGITYSVPRTLFHVTATEM